MERERKGRMAWVRGDDVTPDKLDAAIANAVQGIEGNRANAREPDRSLSDKIHGEALARLFSERLRNLRAKQNKSQ